MREATERTLLMVDDHHVLYRSGTRRVLQPLSRHPANPLIAGRAGLWDADIAYNSIYRDPVSGRYQMWYQSYAAGTQREWTHACTVSYAESADGIEWVRPDLGLYAFNDVADTNIVLLANGGTSHRYGASVIVDRRDDDPARRYKMAHFDFAIDEAAGGREYPGLNVAFSPDGIHWTKHPQAPLLRISYGGFGEALPFQGPAEEGWSLPLTMSDAFDVAYDPPRDAFMLYGKMWIDGPDGGMHWKHALGRSQSRDFLHWSPAELLLTPDEHDPPFVEFHTTPVFFYNGCYFATLQILNRGENAGVIDIELAISRDGIHWQRPFRQPYFLARNEAGRFDSGSIFTNSTPIVLDYEIRFYYGGYSQGATGPVHIAASGVGVATLPRDRFAGLQPIDEICQVTLRPLDIAHCQEITINANAGKGMIWAEVLDARSFRIPGFVREHAVPITGDGLRHPVRWKHKHSAELPRGKYMLRFHLENAELFAVTIKDQQV
jgi:hypothetical protein